MWLRELSSCFCLTVMPGPAWLLLKKICIAYLYSGPCISGHDCCTLSSRGGGGFQIESRPLQRFLVIVLKTNLLFSVSRSFFRHFFISPLSQLCSVLLWPDDWMNGAFKCVLQPCFCPPRSAPFECDWRHSHSRQMRKTSSNAAAHILPLSLFIQFCRDPTT